MTSPSTPAAAGVMGVLNVTPDSFSDGGRYLDLDAALVRAGELVAQGAAIIDVGGESTRPGAAPVDPAEEQARVVPVLEAIAEMCDAAGVRRCIDTRNAATARAAVAAGATLLNDVSASLHRTAADLGVGWVAMHMAGDPTTMQRHPTYGDVVEEVRAFLAERAETARREGVEEVWVDPGIGFGKSTAHNVALIAHLGRIVADGTPVLVGTSRKRSLGVLLARSDAAAEPHPGPAGGRAYFEEHEPVPVADVADRLVGSLTTATWAIIHGARLVRAHDVGATVRAAAVVAGTNGGPGPAEEE